MSKQRRVAVNRLFVDGREIRPCAIEIVDGKVMGYYKLTEELPNTEWLGGTARIINGELVTDR